MADLQKAVSMGMRPSSDITVKFDSDFSPDVPAFPKEIRLGIRDSARELKILPLGVTAPFELHLGMTQAERHKVLGEFREADIVQAVIEALGDKWRACDVKLSVTDQNRF